MRRNGIAFAPSAMRFAITLVGAMLLAFCASAKAQQTGKVPRMGFLDTSTASGRAVLAEVLRQELSKLGWIEGKNITIEYRFAEQKNERSPELLAADLVRLKVDLIVVTGAPDALAAKGASSTIPIVMTALGDPVEAGLLGVLRVPEAMSPGLSSLAFELNTKSLEILKDAVPKLARVGLLRRSASQNFQLKPLRAAASALKLKLEEIETQPDSKGLESAFQTAKQKQVGAIMTTTSKPFFRRKKADRRACRQIPLAGYLLPEGVCR